MNRSQTMFRPMGVAMSQLQVMGWDPSDAWQA